MAGHLTEALRLVLLPTLRAKLQGDYRTGKRINLKKVCVCAMSEWHVHAMRIRSASRENFCADESIEVHEYGCEARSRTVENALE